MRAGPESKLSFPPLAESTARPGLLNPKVGWPFRLTSTRARPPLRLVGVAPLLTDKRGHLSGLIGGARPGERRRRACVHARFDSGQRLLECVLVVPNDRRASLRETRANNKRVALPPRFLSRPFHSLVTRRRRRVTLGRLAVYSAHLRLRSRQRDLNLAAAAPLAAASHKPRPDGRDSPD